LAVSTISKRNHALWVECFWIKAYVYDVHNIV
jgi:hypothetical protein